MGVVGVSFKSKLGMSARSRGTEKSKAFFFLP